MYWRKRLRDIQNDISQKNIDTMKAAGAVKYTEMAEKILADFENIYNRVLLVAAEANRKPTPADLYQLEDYWKIQIAFKAECQKFGEELFSLLIDNFKQVYIDIYEGIAIGAGKVVCPVEESEINKVLDKVWPIDDNGWKSKFWLIITLLWDGLNGELMNCVITGKPQKSLKKRLQKQFDTNLIKLNTLITTETTYVQTHSAMRSYKDSKKNFSNTLNYLSAYVKKFGEENEVNVINKLEKIVNENPCLLQELFPKDMNFEKKGGPST